MDVREFVINTAKQIYVSIGPLGSVLLGIIFFILLVALIGVFPHVFIGLGLFGAGYVVGFEVHKRQIKTNNDDKT